MKLSFTGILSDDERFIDADSGKGDFQDQQATQPLRLREGGKPLSGADRIKAIDLFFDHKNANSKLTMLRQAGVADDDINRLMAGDSREAWDVYETALNAKRDKAWDEKDKQQPHLGLWGYRRRIVSVEDWKGTPRDEVVVRVKHFVLSNEAEVARLKSEVDRFERFESSPPASREPIPEDVQAFVWRRDGGRCVKCGGQERLEFDHIIPFAKGGSNTERNIQLLCEYHNRMKGVGDLLFPQTAEDDRDQ